MVAGALAGVAFLASRAGSNRSPSTCFGSPGSGSLQDGWKLPRRGKNFRAYSDLAWMLERTFVHSTVYAVVLEAYRQLETSQAEHEFIYGETGSRDGGPFKPHRTHQNGLSVDFMVPVRDATGAANQIPTSVLNELGYALEFDDSGRLGELTIDFEALASHLAELKRAATRSRARIANVIFHAPLRARLARTRAWPHIRDLPFMTRAAWIRHDEHYHVDFAVDCGTR